MERKKEQTIVFLNAMSTGFFGGLVLATIQLIFYYFNISKISHRMILNFFYISGHWVEKWYGYLFFILFIAIMSILLSIIYCLILKKIKGWVTGALFGLFIWAIISIVIPVGYYKLSFTKVMLSYSNVASFSMFLLYGIFVGYSISYDYEITVYNRINEKSN